MSPEKTPLLIIGGGPAGYTAALYAARANRTPTLYEGPQPGGQLTITTDVENYPGYPQGVLGPQMMEDFAIQARRFGADLRRGTITAVDFSQSPYQLTVDGKHHLEAQAVIIATGAAAKWLDIPGEQRLNGKGVSACAVCDGFFFKGQEVAVVGGGDSAAEEATYLAKLCYKVHLLVRRDQMRASAIMQARVRHTPNIEIHWHTEVEEVVGDRLVTGVKIVHNQTQERTLLPIQGLFIAVGHQPNTKLFTPYLDHDQAGYLLTMLGTTCTNLPGIFAAGDVQDKRYRQAVTAAGSGCMAALDAEHYLATLSYAPPVG